MWFRLVEDRQERHAGRVHRRCRLADDGDAIALRDHRQQRATLNVEAQDREVRASACETLDDVVMHLGSGAAVPDDEGLARQIGPSDARSIGERMARGQRGQKSFAPYWPRMAIGKLGRAGHEGQVQPVGPKPHDAIARRAFGDLDLDAWMPFPVSLKQVGEKAAGYQGMYADAQTALLGARHHAGGPNGVVEMVDAGRHPLDEIPTGFCQPDAARVTLEQQDAEVFLQRLHAGAHARLTDAERVRGVTKI